MIDSSKSNMDIIKKIIFYISLFLYLLIILGNIFLSILAISNFFKITSAAVSFLGSKLPAIIILTNFTSIFFPIIFISSFLSIAAFALYIISNRKNSNLNIKEALSTNSAKILTKEIIKKSKSKKSNLLIKISNKLPALVTILNVSIIILLLSYIMGFSRIISGCVLGYLSIQFASLTINIPLLVFVIAALIPILNFVFVIKNNDLKIKNKKSKNLTFNNLTSHEIENIMTISSQYLLEIDILNKALSDEQSQKITSENLLYLFTFIANSEEQKKKIEKLNDIVGCIKFVNKIIQSFSELKNIKKIEEVAKICDILNNTDIYKKFQSNLTNDPVYIFDEKNDCYFTKCRQTYEQLKKEIFKKMIEASNEISNAFIDKCMNCKYKKEIEVSSSLIGETSLIRNMNLLKKTINLLSDINELYASNEHSKKFYISPKVRVDPIKSLKNLAQFIETTLLPAKRKDSLKNDIIGQLILINYANKANSLLFYRKSIKDHGKSQATKVPPVDQGSNSYIYNIFAILLSINNKYLPSIVENYSKNKNQNIKKEKIKKINDLMEICKKKNCYLHLDNDTYKYKYLDKVIGLLQETTVVENLQQKIFDIIEKIDEKNLKNNEQNKENSNSLAKSIIGDLLFFPNRLKIEEVENLINKSNVSIFEILHSVFLNRIILLKVIAELNEKEDCKQNMEDKDRFLRFSIIFLHTDFFKFIYSDDKTLKELLYCYCNFLLLCESQENCKQSIDCLIEEFNKKSGEINLFLNQIKDKSQDENTLKQSPLLELITNYLNTVYTNNSIQSKSVNTLNADQEVTRI